MPDAVLECRVADHRGGRRRRLRGRFGWWARRHADGTSEAAAQGSLANAREGEEVCVRGIQSDTRQARRLRELGMLEGKSVRVLSPGNPLICQIGDCRFGLCQRLARCVLVEPVMPHPAAKSA